MNEISDAMKLTYLIGGIVALMIIIGFCIFMLIGPDKDI